MGNHLTACLSPASDHRHPAPSSDPHDVEGYSYSYDRPCPDAPSVSTPHNDSTTTFRRISGASVSANTSTPPSGTLLLPFDDHLPRPSNALECSVSFQSAQLQPMRCSTSGPLSDCHRSGGLVQSGPLERSSVSGPICMSEPLDGGYGRRRKMRVVTGIRRAINKTIIRGHNSIVAPITGIVIKKVDRLEESEGVDAGLHWAQGKAGEDRVHVVVWEGNWLLFVGIYDGFYGPDAPDYLLTHLYSAVHAELKDLLWEENKDPSTPREQKKRKKKKRKPKEETCSWKPKVDAAMVDREAVMGALSRALIKTEEAFLGIADSMAVENPELGLMGSCVLAVLMRGEDVYLMNVGDSRAVVGRKPEKKLDGSLCLEAVQLTMDHSTSEEEEVERIRREHSDDPLAVSSNRVKGKLKVTRAFGAGFLKQPKWNNNLIERFRIDYIGSSPYITCTPSLHHHRLGPNDRFLILSSDGLYQYLTNQEAVSEVEFFLTVNPDGDPAQHLVQEALFRAADDAQMEFNELLQIPQGDRRRYHDDISVVVVSIEGRIWRSCL